MIVKPPKTWLLAVVLVFSLVFSASLIFEYVEGDDASMIAFHALGRRIDVQPPYSPYHSMMDAVLGFLPSQERLLRMTAISLSAISAIAMTFLLLTLAFDWLKPFIEVARLPSALAVLLAIPELLYLGLVFTPSLIAMALVLTAHLIARRSIPADGSRGYLNFPRLILAAALFGAGAAFRWDIVTYGMIIVADLALPPLEDKPGPGRRQRRFGIAISWGALAVLAFFAAIVISGYRSQDVLGIARFGASFSASRPPLSASSLASIHSLLTPGFGIFSILGLWSLIRRIPRLAILSALGVLLVAPWILSGVPKYLLVALPGLLAAFVLGFSQAWTAWKERDRIPARLMIVLLLSLPWVVGVRITFKESSWGPGFELRPFTSATANVFKLSLGPGAAAPTPEGPRPIFGHFYVLVGGGWRHLLHDLAVERSKAIQTAAEQRLPILRLRGSNGYDTAEFVAHGFVTNDSAVRRSPRVAHFLERRFQNPRGIRVTYLRVQQPDFLRSGAVLERLSRAYGDRVLILSYPADLKHLYQRAPRAIEPLGPMSAFLRLEELRRSVLMSGSDPMELPPG